MKIFVAAVITAFSLSAHADPLAEFQAIVARCKEAHAARPSVRVSYREARKEWFKTVTRVDGITYDVRKTDSLASPFSAYIEITEVMDGDKAPTEDAASALVVDIDGRAMRTIDRLKFAYQEGAWQLVGGNLNGASRAAKGESFRTDVSLTVSRDSYLKRPAEAPISACLGLPK